MKVKLLSHVRLLATLWAAAYQAPPSMGFSRQEDWGGVPLPSLMVLGKREGHLQIPPERMKRLGQSRNNVQLWMCLVVEVKSNAANNIAGAWNVRFMNLTC